MKIVISARKFIQPLVGGVDVYADRLRTAFTRLGHEVIILAVDSQSESDGGSLSICSESIQGVRIVRILTDPHRQTQASYDTAYDAEMGEVVKSFLKTEKPNLFIVLNFYMLTLAPVQAAKELNIPVVHIATDFVPVCRRATYIRGDGTPCQVGESLKSCSACFISQHSSGRLASSVMSRFPDTTLVRWARKKGSYRFPHPFRLLQPYWKQVAIMEQRLSILPPLRDQVDLVLTPTRYTFDAFKQNGFRPDRVRLAPFGFETDHTQPGSQYQPSDHIRFLFIGRFQPYKGAHLLIDAFNNLHTPKDATLTLYGIPDGYDTYFEEIKRKIASNQRIRFGGRLAPSELAKAFGESDYFILPSTWHENSPLVLQDALQSGTPVIASAVGGVTDLVQDGVNGLLFPMGDQKALQVILQKVIDHPNLGETLRAGIQLPDIDQYAQSLLDQCQELNLIPPN